MFIFIEWILSCIFFLYGLSCFQTRGDYYYDYYYDGYNNYEFSLGCVYFIGGIIVAMIAYAHTSNSDDYYPSNSYFGYDNNNSTHCNSSYTSDKRNNVRISWETPVKTQNQIIADIVKDYPKTLTCINEVTKFEIKKKSFFFFGNKPTTVVTTITPPLSVTEESKEIKNVIMKASNQFTPYEYLKPIRESIVHIERLNDIINVFIKPSDVCSIYGNLNRYCIINFMHKHLKHDFKEVKFIEVDNDNFTEFYKNYAKK